MHRNMISHRSPFAFSAIFSATCIFSALAADTSTWVNLGPAPINSGVLYTGRVSAIICSPSDQNTYYVGGADGGVWRTTDGGSTWTPLSNDWPTSAIGALAFDPTDESVIYAGTGEANYANHSRYGVGVMKSTDGGDTWTQLGADTFAGRCFSKIVVNPTNPQIVYASITPAGGFPEKAAAKGHPQKDAAVGVFRSTDGGETWTQLTNGLPSVAATDIAMKPDDPNTLLAAIGHIFGSNDNGLYKSTDGGDSWTKVSGGGFPTSNLGRMSLAYAPSDANRVYVLIARKNDASGGGASTLGAYRSNDGGKNWTNLNIGSIQSTYGWFLCVVAVVPTDSAVVFMAGLDLYRSTNSGGAWSAVTPPHVDIHAIVFDAGGRLVVGDDGGVHRSANRGTSWTTINGNLATTQFYAGLSTHPTDANVILGGNQDNGSNLRKKDSLEWTNVFGGDGGWTQIDPKNASRMFVEYQGTGNTFYSTNGGQTFNQCSGINGGDRNCFLPPYLIDPNDSKRVIYATHRIYRSTNNGASFSALSNDLTRGGTAAIRALAWAPSDSNIVYAATNDSRVLVSANAGKDWTLLLEDAIGWPRVTRELFVHPSNPDTVYVAGATFGNPKLRRSSDRGQNWTTLDGNLPDIPANTVAADVRLATPVLFLGTDVGLMRSIDDGQTWHRYGSGLPTAAVIDIRLEVSRGRMIVGTQGRGTWSVGVGLPGDLDNNGAVNFEDIDPFVLALSNLDEYSNQYPDVDPLLVGDLDGDGTINFNDIDPFIALLTQ